RRELGPDCHYMVGGDFNGTHSPLGLSESEFSNLYKDIDLKEIFEFCNIPQDKRATQIQFYSGPKINPLQLDGFWASQSLCECLITEETGVYMYKSDLGVSMPYVKTLTQRLAMPSDHYPTFTSIELKKALLKKRL